MISDGSGILSMPVKLTVAIIVLATLTPVIFGMVDTAEESMSTSEAEAEARLLADAVSRAYYGGDGTMISVQMSLPRGEGLAVGGEGGDSYSIRLLSDGEIRKKILLERPAVPILNDEMVVTGDCILIVKCCIEDGRYGVRVSA